MSNKPETTIVTDIIEWIEAHDGNAFHVHGSPMQRQGEPDIIGVLPIFVNQANSKSSGAMFLSLALEVKVPGEDGEKMQLYRLAQWGKNRWCAGVVHSVDEVERLITQYILDLFNNKFMAPDIKPNWFGIGLGKNAAKNGK